MDGDPVDPLQLVGDGLLEHGQAAGVLPQDAERGWSNCRTPRVFHSFPVCSFFGQHRAATNAGCALGAGLFVICLLTTFYDVT